MKMEFYVTKCIKLKGNLRDAVSVSAGGIMSFAAVEDEADDDGFGQDLYTLD